MRNRCRRYLRDLILNCCDAMGANRTHNQSIFSARGESLKHDSSIYSQNNIHTTTIWTAEEEGTASMEQDKALRQQLIGLLKGGEAHAELKDVIADFPAELRGKRPHGVPYSPWELLEHMRIAQWDILEFSRDSRHKSPKFPDGYWPKSSAPPDGSAWDDSVHRFQHDLISLCALVADESTDLHAQIPHGTGQTILREALLAADHNAYHLGQLVLVRRILGAWESKS